jgi:hypothetical protein
MRTAPRVVPAFLAAAAGVPVSDVIARMGYNRLDNRLAKESRREIWRFLAPHPRPERPAR